MMKRKWFFWFLVVVIISACKRDGESGIISDYEGYTLIWSDDFDREINSQYWDFEVGDGTDYGLPPGWGNAERQLYTRSSNNAIVRPDGEGNNVLAITAQRDGSGRYTSAKVTTQNRVSVRFGRIEARIKVPEGRGMWPAFWMLGDNITEIDWPGCGEIDIMEVIGHETTISHSTVHYTDGQNRRGLNGGSKEVSEKLSAGYHIYSVDWTPEMLTFLLDDEVVHQVAIEADMKEFLRSHYIILNVAVGGNWPGNPDASTVFPQSMFVDWVRVYSNDNIDAPAAPALDIEEESLGSVSGSLAAVAFNESFNLFNNLILRAFGAGGEPTFAESDIAVNGEKSLFLEYPGGNWGGAFFTQDPVVDMSEYASGNLKFSLRYPSELADAEIKLESVATAHSLFLKDYVGEEIDNGFVEFTIPLADFATLSLVDLKIPFALWNPVNNAGEYVPMQLLIDNIYFEK